MEQSLRAHESTKCITSLSSRWFLYQGGLLVNVLFYFSRAHNFPSLIAEFSPKIVFAEFISLPMQPQSELIDDIQRVYRMPLRMLLIQIVPSLIDDGQIYAAQITRAIKLIDHFVKLAPLHSSRAVEKLNQPIMKSY